MAYTSKCTREPSGNVTVIGRFIERLYIKKYSKKRLEEIVLFDPKEKCKKSFFLSVPRNCQPD